jgi:chromosome segregation ATPase
MGKERELLQRLIFLWGEASDYTNEPDIMNKRHEEYVELRSIYYKEYISGRPPADEEFDRVIARAARTESERKYSERLAEKERRTRDGSDGYRRAMEQTEKLRKRLDSLWKEISSKDRIDTKSKAYKKYQRLLKYMHAKPGKPGTYEKNVEELPSLGDWTEPSRQRIGDIEL